MNTVTDQAMVSPKVEKQAQPNLEQAVSPRQSVNLIRVYADNEDTKSLCIFSVVLLLALLLTLLIGNFAIPDPFIQKTNSEQLVGTNLQNCKNPSHFESGVLVCEEFSQTIPNFGLFIRNLHPLNQFVFLQIVLLKPKDKNIQINQIIKLIEWTVSLNQKSQIIQKQFIDNVQNTLKVDRDQQWDYDFKKQTNDDNRNIQAYKLNIAFVNKLSQSSIYLQMQAKIYQQLADMKQSYLKAYIINSNFTIFTIVMRQVYFVISLLAGILYILRYRKIPQLQKVTQQKFVAVLSFLTPLFNDPLYPVTILVPNFVSSFLSIIFVTNFVSLLVFKWMVIGDHIRLENGIKRTKTVTAIKIGLTIFVYIAFTGFNLFLTVSHVSDPIYSQRELKSKVFIGWYIFMLIAFFCVLAYILALFIIVLINAQSKLWRNQLYIYFTLFFLIQLAIIIVETGLHPNSFNGPLIFISYTLINTYVLYMQYMYSVCSTEFESVPTNYEFPNGNHEVMTAGTIDIELNLDYQLLQKQNYRREQPQSSENKNNQKESKNQFELE